MDIKSVKVDGFPEQGKPVLVYFDDPDIDPEIDFVDVYADTGAEYFSNCGEDVVYWAYLPMHPLRRTHNGATDVITDSARLDFLDNNLRKAMGWRVGVARVGNIVVTSVIQPAGATSIRDAIDAAIAQNKP